MKLSLAAPAAAATFAMQMPRETPIDVVVVSYNSSATLGECIAPLVVAGGPTVIVVDNASTDQSVALATGLGARVISLGVNHGFAYGCNRGWEAGFAPFVLFLNPDAHIEPASISRLIDVFEKNAAAGLVGPRIVDHDGSLDHSQRRFPRLRSTYAQALFLHRIFPGSSWSGEVVRDARAYETAHPVDWLSGACVLVRRVALEQVGGWAEEFFMYGEDKDLCRRLWQAGYEVLYEPGAVVVHIGGASTPRERVVPMLAASTIRYAQITQSGAGAALTRVGVALGALTHAALTTKGRRFRVGYLRGFLVACSLRLPHDRPASDPQRSASTAHDDGRKAT